MAATSKRKSLFEQFAYNKRKKVLTISGINGVHDNEFKKDWESGSGSISKSNTPNKDHSPARVPETPESEISKFSSKIPPVSSRKDNRKRKARISSSSEESSEQSSSPTVSKGLQCKGSQSSKKDCFSPVCSTLHVGPRRLFFRNQREDKFTHGKPIRKRGAALLLEDSSNSDEDLPSTGGTRSMFMINH